MDKACIALFVVVDDFTDLTGPLTPRPRVREADATLTTRQKALSSLFTRVSSACTEAAHIQNRQLAHRGDIDEFLQKDFWD